jgi:hypothetical protein
MSHSAPLGLLALRVPWDQSVPEVRLGREALPEMGRAGLGVRARSDLWVREAQSAMVLSVRSVPQGPSVQSAMGQSGPLGRSRRLDREVQAAKDQEVPSDRLVR